jgi:2-phospho-L-lactate guanylyltransferase
VKQRADCKSRLAGRLGPEARLSLVRCMLERVLQSLGGAPSIGRIAVVSPERDTVPPEITVLGDAGHGLNEALGAAQREVLEQGASELVVLPADLPLLTSADVEALVLGGRQSGFALAPDVAGTGTNALYLPPAAGFRFQFGPGSCQRHVAEAIRLGLRPGVVRARGLEFDVDAIDDLTRLERERGHAAGRHPQFPMKAHG